MHICCKTKLFTLLLSKSSMPIYAIFGFRNHRSRRIQAGLAVILQFRVRYPLRWLHPDRHFAFPRLKLCFRFIRQIRIKKTEIKKELGFCDFRLKPNSKNFKVNLAQWFLVLLRLIKQSQGLQIHIKCFFHAFSFLFYKFHQNQFYF